MPTENGEVCYIGWKDQVFVLIMSSFILGDLRVLWERKRPKETSSKAKTARAPFSDGKAVKVLLIPAIIDGYNYNIGVVDEFNYLIA
jgi:hypothetical protein